MKIIIFNWRDIKNPLGGGAEISLFEHAKYWHKKGAEITWFAASFENAKPIEIIEGIKTVRKGSTYTVHLWSFYYFLSGKLGKPDLIIDSFHGLPFFSIFYFPKTKIIALINEVAGKIWFVNTNIVIAGIGFMLEKVSLAMYKSILFMTGSESTKNEMVKAKIPEENITVVHHGTHILKVSERVFKEKMPIILYLGRVTADKGIEDALQAFSDIKQQVSDVQLWIAGGEEKKGTLNEFISQLSDSEKKNISYFGFVNEQKKFELLKKSWVLVHPSFKEGWGLTVIEAASQGVPTVGYNVAGLIDSVQNGKTGILVEAKNTTQLAEAIMMLLKDSKKYKKFSENAVQWSKQFTWETSVKKSWDVVKYVYDKSSK